MFRKPAVMLLALLMLGGTIRGGEGILAADLDPRHWVYIESRETGKPPILLVSAKDGKERTLRPEADTILISYLSDRAWGRHPRLAISLGDTNRVLLRFPDDFDDVESAKLRLEVKLSATPPTAPFEVAVHLVTEKWNEADTNWENQPAFEKDPTARFELKPEAGAIVTVDLTSAAKAWANGDRKNHGVLLKVASPVKGALPPSRAPRPRPRQPSGTWVQPEILTGTPFSDTLPWAETVESAIERARKEGKLVLAIVVPVGDRRWCSGYAAAAKEWKGMAPPPWGVERTMAIDSGLVKERVMMAVFFTDPEIAHLVKSHFVPVRLRLHTYHFDAVGSRSGDPLKSLGTTAVSAGGPSLVFARPDGRLVHACRRMGVFSAPMVRRMLRAVLEKAGVKKVAPWTPSRHPRLSYAWRIAREGRFKAALEVVRTLELADSPLRWEAAFLHGHLAGQLGDEETARAQFEIAAAGDPKGPWGSKAAIRLMPREARLKQWEAFTAFEFDPLAEQTEVGAAPASLADVLARAVEYLLLMQSADGGWPDPFHDTHPMAGPGSPFDRSVARTGIVVDALLRMRPRLPDRRGEIDRAIAGGIDYVGRFADAPKPYVWQVTYALHLQVALLDSNLQKAKRNVARARAARLVTILGTMQKEGGWSYMPPPRIHSFNTAPVLLLLTEIRRLGVEVPKGMTDAAAKLLEELRQEGEPREFLYAKNVNHKSLRASSCRTAVCELALLEHGGGGDLKPLRAGIELFFTHEPFVRNTTKVFESYFSPTAMHDAYHYYFGHYYAARALSKLPAAEARKLAKRQIELVLRQVELDGSFVDAQMQGKSYSTAMAVLTLLEDLRHGK